MKENYQPITIIPEVPSVESANRKGVPRLILTELTRAPLLTGQQEIEVSQAIERGLSAQEELFKNGNLSLEEIKRLEQVIEEGSEARSNLIMSNTRLVVSIVKKYQGQGLPFFDLFQEGCVGLIIAVGKFDWRRGNKFSTHASWWIRQGVTRAIEEKSREIRLPNSILSLAKKIYRIMAELQQKGCQPTIGEIAEQVGVKPAKVKKVLLESRQPFSLEESLEGEKEVDPYEVIADQDLLSPEENFSRAQLIKMIKRAFINDVLNPKEALVLKLRYGFGDEGEACTLREVGKRLNLSHERIRQLEEMGLAKLKFLLSR